jgi:hypothetical protein
VPVAAPEPPRPVEAPAEAAPLSQPQQPEQPEALPEPEPPAEAEVAVEPAAVVEAPASAPALGVRADRGVRGWVTTPLAAVAAVALIEAGVIAWLMASGGVAALSSGQVVIRSQPAGARVIIDAEDRGATPLTTSISPGTHTIGISVGKTERFLPVQIQAGVQTEIYIELPNVTLPVATPGKSPAGKK